MDWWEKKENWFDCFEVLGISENASEKEIKDAYRKLAKKYHTDLETGNRELFEQATLAYNTLNDKKTKERYIAFYQKYQKAKKQHEEEVQQESLTFEEIVQIYKEKEAEIKIAIVVMISTVEKKEKQFFSIYNNFCQALKENKLNANDFEIRRQKLYSLALSNINSIKEIEDIIESNLKNIDFDYEKKKLKELKAKFKETDTILTSSYKVALLKLKKPKLKYKFKLPNSESIALVTSYSAGIIFIICMAFLIFYHTGNDIPKEEEIVDEVDMDSTIEEELSEAVPGIETSSSDKLLYANTMENPTEDCILWQNIPDESEFVEFSNTYTVCGREVFRANDEYSTGFLFDANDHSLLFGNYISYGGPYYQDGRYTFYILTVDGYHYTLSAEDFRTVISIESAYSYESEPYYLEGYGYVIEAKSCGEKYLIDAKTRFPFIRDFDDYEPMYYDEEFGCNVYCFKRFDGQSKYYLKADDLKKVLKKEYSWDEN